MQHQQQSSHHAQNDRLTAFLGNLHPSCVQGDFDGRNGLFAGLDVQEVRLVRDRETDQPRGHGYAVFKNQDSLEAALQLDGSVVCGQQVKIDLKRPRSAGGFQGSSRQQGGGQFSRQSQRSEGGPFVAFVANLPEGATDADLTAMFQSLDLKSAHLARHKDTGEVRGFGFAEFKNKESLAQALTLNGASWMDKEIKVSVHEPKAASAASSNFPSTQFGQSSDKQWGHQPPSRFPGTPSWQATSTRTTGEDGAFRKVQPAAPKPAQEPLPLEIDDKDRPKLVLKKAQPNKAGAAAASTPAPAATSSKSNPFGNAKPVDTASKLLSIEEAKSKQAEVAAAAAPEVAKD